ncbi:hypothetical protein DFO69_1979 [Bacillus subtilis]|nr:hypothetical protein DFO69_1979 [Bacillus subtilis]
MFGFPFIVMLKTKKLPGLGVLFPFNLPVLH